MMLSRVAENLFWIGRYVERAENVARLLDVARRMSALPRETGRPLSNEWSSVLIAAGARDVYGPAIERADAGSATDHLLFETQNPSSVVNCVTHARDNARAIRFVLTSDLWEALNTFWSDGRRLGPQDARGPGLSNLIDWVKSRTAQFRGALHGTMARADAFHFIRMGQSIERIDCTARLLDVKYHVLLVNDVGSSEDEYQWISLLQSAAAHRTYTAMREADVSAHGVAEFLILEPLFPRSILFNAGALSEAVSDLEVHYGMPTGSHSDVHAFITDLKGRNIDDILNQGLHEFLTQTIERNYALANSLSQSYGFAAMTADGADDSTDQ